MAKKATKAAAAKKTTKAAKAKKTLKTAKAVKKTVKTSKAAKVSKTSKVAKASKTAKTAKVAKVKKAGTSGRREWTKEDVRNLKALAKARTPVAKIARTLKRTPGATAAKAFKLGVSLDTRR